MIVARQHAYNANEQLAWRFSSPEQISWNVSVCYVDRRKRQYGWSADQITLAVILCLCVFSCAGDVVECGIRWQDDSYQAPPSFPRSPLILWRWVFISWKWERSIQTAQFIDCFLVQFLHFSLICAKVLSPLQKVEKWSSMCILFLWLCCMIWMWS